ncbi:FUSC family protein [Allostreptomyces psammosilenae]|uniref:Putative membrane protein YccC n=1 Tax=Allostreptomyces psammosilenae TaxID=1892865 RepID=A0A853A5Q2_9ACTN|nr:FUSC family protein [Allostreptomyces psammosilenae]NYI05858.1 putative membrane protein YccC [Allostreptomyces psammosilenae]
MTRPAQRRERRAALRAHTSDDRWAPQWLVRAMRGSDAGVPAGPTVRAAVGMGLPLLLGLLLDQVAAAVPAALGALYATTNDRDESHRGRLARIGVPALAGTVGLLLGEALLPAPPMALAAALAALGLVSGAVSGVGPVTSAAAMQFLVTTVVGSGLVLPDPWWLPPLVFAGGAALVLLPGVLPGAFRGARGVARAGERRAVAEVYLAVAELLDTIGGAGTEEEREARAVAARRRLTARLSAAYDTLFGHRLRGGRSERRERRLLDALDAAIALGEASTTLLWEGRPVDPAGARVARRLAEAVRGGTPPDPPPPLPRATPGQCALDDALRAAAAGLGGPPPAPPTGNAAAAGDAAGGAAGAPPTAPAPLARVVEHAARRDLPPARERLIRARDRCTGRSALHYGARLALCMGLAGVAAGLLHGQRVFWLPVTVAFVLKPDFGSVFVRATQRALGTVAGVLVSVPLLLWVPAPGGLAVVAVAAAGCLPWATARHYGLSTAALTPIMMVFVEFTGEPGTALIGERVLDTFVASAIVLVAGYLVWPESWHARIGPHFADAVDAVRAHLEQVLLPREAEEGPDGRGPRAEPSRLRRKAYRALAAARTALEQALAEPPPVSDRAAAWWPAIAALERVTDAVTATTVRLRHGVPYPPPEQAARLVGALDELAAAVRRHRAPDPAVPLPDPAALVPGGTLAEVTERVRAVRLLVGGPDSLPRRPSAPPRLRRRPS